ncbi:MAG: DedA family protein, partial [Wenzhouxiangella sp.]
GVVLVGTILGNGTGFYLGQRWGASVLQWAPLQRFLGPVIARAQDFMFRRGEWAIVLGRMSTATRITVPFLAGASGVTYRRFLLFDVPAALVWALVWIGLGFFLGASWEAIKEVSGNAALLILILFVLAIIIGWIAARVAAHQRRVQEIFWHALRATGTDGIARTLAPGFRWLGRRLDPRLSVGLSLSLGFITLMAAIGVIGLVFSQTQAVRGLALIDFPVLEWMRDMRTDQAVTIARTGLLAFHWPGIFGLAIPVMALVLWRVGWGAALRIGVGVVGAAGGAYFLDRFVLEGVVPGAEFPSVPVAVAAVFLVNITALMFRNLDWGPSVACAAVGMFLLCTVAMGTLVAGWAAPSGIALGLALGLAWASTLELAWFALRLAPAPPAPESESGPGTGTGPNLD